MEVNLLFVLFIASGVHAQDLPVSSDGNGRLGKGRSPCTRHLSVLEPIIFTTPTGRETDFRLLHLNSLNVVLNIKRFYIYI